MKSNHRKWKLSGHTFWIQHSRDIQIFLSNIESCVQILQWIVLRQFAIVDEVGSVTMNQCTEGKTILWKMDNGDDIEYGIL